MSFSSGCLCFGQRLSCPLHKITDCVLHNYCTKRSETSVLSVIAEPFPSIFTSFCNRETITNPRSTINIEDAKFHHSGSIRTSGWMLNILLINRFSHFINHKVAFSQETNPPPSITDFDWSAKTVGHHCRKEKLQEGKTAFIPAALLTHGRFHEQPQRQRRSRPRGSECNFSAGGTSLSQERNLGNRKEHTTQIIVFGMNECTALWCDCPRAKGLLCLSSWNDCSLMAYEKYNLSHCFRLKWPKRKGFQFSHVC